VSLYLVWKSAIFNLIFYLSHGFCRGKILKKSILGLFLPQKKEKNIFLTGHFPRLQALDCDAPMPACSQNYTECGTQKPSYNISFVVALDLRRSEIRQNSLFWPKNSLHLSRTLWLLLVSFFFFTQKTFRILFEIFIHYSTAQKQTTKNMFFGLWGTIYATEV